MAASGVRISCDTSAITSFFVCCKLVLPGDVGKRCHDSQHRAAGVLAFADGGHAQHVAPRPRAANRDLALDGIAVDQQTGQRLRRPPRPPFGLRQPLEQIAPDERLSFDAELRPPRGG